MEIFRSQQQLKSTLNTLRNNGKKIGFVPTMGALHEGHLSLVDQCKAENDICVVSIFVNPTQFNEKDDFDRYPRVENQDIDLLEKRGCNLVYIPEVKDIYPDDQPKIISIDLLHLDKILEGAKRPGHFDGVVTIVKKLFDIVEPDNAYFGQKDFQQCLVIERLVDYFNMNIQIVRCPIQREKDGLAMSSRNLLLHPEERALAPIIYKTLKAAANMLKTENVDDVKEWAKKTLEKHNNLQFEYLEIANALNLLPINTVQEAKNIVICTAVRIGKIRLIDNIVLK